MIYKRILVAVDGSAVAKAGLSEAIRIVKDQGAVLGLLLVVDQQAAFGWPEGAMAAGGTIEALRESGEAMLKKINAGVLRQGVRPETRVVETIGEPVADIIVRHARRWRADLIVMGTHGRSGIDRVLMGSDAERTVRIAPVPVLLVRAKAAGKAATAKKPATGRARKTGSAGKKKAGTRNAVQKK